MKFKNLHQWLLITGTAGLLAISSTTTAQTTRYPDGTIRYPDGSIRYPDGSVRTGRDGTMRRTPAPRDRDYRTGRDGYDNRPIIIVDGNGRNVYDTRRLPPGHAKKVYNTRSARNFTPSQRQRYMRKYGYVPPIVIAVSERYCERDRRGRFFYRNPQGFTYWRDGDGFYVLDGRYF